MPKKRELDAYTRKAIIRTKRSGQSADQVAKLFKVCRATVYNTINRFKETQSVESAKRTGRPRKTSAYTDRLIARKVVQNPKITVDQLKNDLSLTIGLTQIRQRIHEAGLYGRVVRRKPFISATNRRKRMAFALKYRYKSLDFWQNILWTDESKFEFKGSKRRVYVYRRPGQEYDNDKMQGTVKHGGGSIMVWGCFSWYGVGSFVKIEGTMTALKYIEILERAVPESVIGMGIETKFIYQQDNDPKHTAKVTQRFFQDNLFKLLEWPPQSPDLNPIEHLWDHLDRALKLTQVPLGTDFFTSLYDTWTKIDEKVLKKLVESMPARLEAVIKSKGGPTKY